MNEKRWFLLKDEQVRGPLAAFELLKELERIGTEGCRFWAKGKPAWLDYSHVSDDLKKESMTNAPTIQTEDLWYLRNGRTELGPLTFQKLIEHLKTLKTLEKVMISKGNPKQWQEVFGDELIMEKLGINRRHNARVPLQGTMTFLDGSLRGHQAELSSVSQGGFGFRAVEGLSIGEVFKGSFISPNLSPAIHFQAEVVSLNPQIGVGAKFLHLSTEAQAQIIFYVNQFINKHPETDFKKIA